MLTRAPIGPTAQHNTSPPLAAVVSLLLFGLLVTMLNQAFGGVRLDLRFTPTALIGELLYVQWAFPFMVLGFLLTVALIGAVVIARREEGEGPATDVDATARLEPHPSDVTAAPRRRARQEV
jgi:NADH-quinone oxidoreductase subunit J